MLLACCCPLPCCCCCELLSLPLSAMGVFGMSIMLTDQRFELPGSSDGPWMYESQASCIRCG